MRIFLGKAFCVLCLASLVLSSAFHAEARDVELAVDRGKGAQDCPTEEGLWRAIELVGSAPSVERPDGVLRIHVRIDRADGVYRAEIRASGRKTGIRTLKVPGGTCEALTDAVAVTLALLMDREIREPEPQPDPEPEEPSKPEPPAEPTVPAQEPPPEPSPPPPPELSSKVPSPPVHYGIAVGGALTHGLPETLSGLADAELWGRKDWLLVGVGGFWGPTREVKLDPGAVDVRLVGARLRGCGRIWGEYDGWHGAVCAEGVVGQLRGEGKGFAEDRAQRRPWYGLGASARVGGGIHGPLGWAVTGGVLAPLQRESFSVDNVGEAYETDRVTFFFGPQLSLLIL
jgi:hypothetical protein